MGGGFWRCYVGLGKGVLRRCLQCRHRMNGRPKRLVIDASVAGSATENEHPAAKLCLDFLNRVRDLKYHVVMNKEIIGEWNRHRTQYSFQWITYMTEPKRVFKGRIARNELLRRCMSTDAMTKDVHLLEAALATDKRIVSNDDRARNSFRKIRDVRLVVWVNPCRPEERAVEWLSRGARIESYRQLGHATGYGA